MITHIAFDVGGVLLDIANSDDVKKGFREFLTQEIKVDKDENELTKIINSSVSDWFSEHDTGINIWSKHFSLEVSQKIVDNYKYFHARRYQPTPSMMDLCRNLSNTYKVGILSNFAKDFVLDKNFFSQEIFDPIIFSGVVGIKKPDPRIYQLYCHQANCQPENLLFIDDTPENVHRASNLGITALLFTTQPKLESDLLEINLKGTLLHH